MSDSTGGSAASIPGAAGADSIPAAADTGATITGGAGGSDSLAGAASTDVQDTPPAAPAKPAAAAPKPAPAPAKAPAPAPVVTKVTDAPVPTPPAPLTPEQVADARNVAVIEELLTSFKTSLSPRIVTDAMRYAAAGALSNVFTRIVLTPSKDSMDVVWDFFVENADTVLQETVALSGAASLAVDARQRLELAYMLYRKAVKGIDVGDATKVSKNVLTNILKCPKLVAYLSIRSKTVTKK